MTIPNISTIGTSTLGSLNDKPDTAFPTLAEVAEIPRVPVKTLRWRRPQGIGPRFFKMGRRLVVTTAGDLTIWVEDQNQPPRSRGRVSEIAMTAQDRPAIDAREVIDGARAIENAVHELCRGTVTRPAWPRPTSTSSWPTLSLPLAHSHKPRGRSATSSTGPGTATA